jgi:hypothetical protein
MLSALRKAGLTVEPHTAWFRHDTPDTEWLPEVGRKGWVVLMRDQKIGKRPLEFQALINGKVKAFVLVTGELPNKDNAQIFIKAMPAICTMVETNNFPFLAKVRTNGSVELWKGGAKRRKK